VVTKVLTAFNETKSQYDNAVRIGDSIM